jgi:hypothetical protein
MLNAPDKAVQFQRFVNETNFDLSGGRKLIETQRHAHYCDDLALEKATKKTFKRMGWKCP